jgi:hypothetical protein
MTLTPDDTARQAIDSDGLPATTARVWRLVGLLTAVTAALVALQRMTREGEMLRRLAIPPPRIDVVYAEWGAAGRITNVTSVLRRMCNDREICSERHDLVAELGDDPPGLRKTLHVEFSCGRAMMLPVDSVEMLDGRPITIDLRCD